MSNLQQLPKQLSFSGHESFPCKSLWLKKGYDFCEHKLDFNAPQSVVELGVGKNMVASIRYWMKAFGLYEDDRHNELSNYLFNSNTGKDPYLEDIATLWLLHYKLVSCQKATLYYLLFCGLQRERNQFSRDQIINYVKMRMTESGKQSLFNENTVKKDVGVLLQMYLLPLKPQSNEDYSTLLIDLDLIRYNAENKSYFFNVDGKRQVTKEVFLYGLIELKGTDNSLPYEIIKDSLGLTFCMNDKEIIEMLKELVNAYPEVLAYSDVAGIRQIQFVKDIAPFQILDDYYENI